MNIEEQLSRIKSKADLRKWVEELPEDAKGLILVHKDSDPEDKAVYSFHEVGPITVAESLWLARSYEHYLFGLTDEE